MNQTAHAEFVSYQELIANVLDAIGAAGVLEQQRAVLIKPNLINASPFPITTAPACVKAIIEYVQSCSRAEIVIGEV